MKKNIQEIIKPPAEQEVYEAEMWTTGNTGVTKRKDYNHCFRMIPAWQEKVKEEARRNKYIETAFGRRRYLPDIALGDRKERASAERKAMNTPVQGTVADIIKLAMGRILAGLPERPWLKPIMQIHDEVTFILPEDKLEEGAAFVKSCMEPQPYPEFALPLVAEASAGKTFGSLEDLKAVKR